MNVLIFLLIPHIFAITEKEAQEYLEKYGFLSNSSITTEGESIIALEESIIKFQEFYNLPVDGILNIETLNLMDKPRCGVKDFPLAYTASTKWNKTDLTWYFPLADSEVKIVATKCFEIWQNGSNLKFKYSYSKPDIVITFSDKVDYHRNYIRCLKGNCPYKFDGKGLVLGHAFYPNQNNCVEIHLDKSEDWYYGFGSVPADKSSLFSVLLHEIGHSLGIGHSADPNSVMYSFYRPELSSLSNDDKFAIQALYGMKISTTEIPVITTQTSEQTAPNLCDSLVFDAFLITSNYHMYIFYKGWVWTIKIGDKYRKPNKISEYLPISTISYIYQRVSGDVVIISNDLYYIVDFPSFVIKSKHSVENLGVPKGKKITSIFTSYRGKTYIFYDKYYFLEFDECNLNAKKYGIISELFPGIPSDVHSVFRYINGNLYFFRNSTYYEFNEFSNKLVRAGAFDLSLFEITCPNKSILEQLKELLTKISTSMSPY